MKDKLSTFWIKFTQNEQILEDTWLLMSRYKIPFLINLKFPILEHNSLCIYVHLVSRDTDNFPFTLTFQEWLKSKNPNDRNSVTFQTKEKISFLFVSPCGGKIRQLYWSLVSKVHKLCWVLQLWHKSTVCTVPTWVCPSLPYGI